MVAPWLRSADVLGAIQAGSNAGLQLRAAALREAAQQAENQRAADALQLHYAQTEAENQRSAQALEAHRQQAAASLALRGQEAQALEQHRMATEEQSAANALRMAEQNKAMQAGQAESRAETKRYHDYQMNKPETSKLFHVGNSLVRVNPDGTQEVLFTSDDPSKIDDWEHRELTAGLNRAFQATKDMDDPLVKDAQKKLDAFNKRIRSGGKKIEAKPLLRAQAMEFLHQANGDKEKARALARDAGYTLE